MAALVAFPFAALSDCDCGALAQQPRTKSFFLLSFFSSRLYFHSLYFAFSLFFVEVFAWELIPRGLASSAFAFAAAASLRLGLCPPRCPPPVRDPSAPVRTRRGEPPTAADSPSGGSSRTVRRSQQAVVARRGLAAWPAPLPAHLFRYPSEKKPSRARVPVRTVKYFKNTTHNHDTHNNFFLPTPLTPLSPISPYI